MAIAFDSASNNSATLALTFSHTCSGSDRLLLVSCHGADQSFSVTYNGVAMTELYDGTPGSPFKFIAVYALVAPATGANDVVITRSGSTPVIAGAVSYTGVDQTTPYDSIDVVTNTGTAVSNGVSSAANDLVVDFVAANRDAAQTVGASQTARVNAGNGDEFMWIGISEEAGAGTVTMSWTLDTSSAWTAAGLNLNVAAGGGGGGNSIAWITA